MAVREGYKQTEVGAIPGDWDQVVLADVVEIIGGGTPKTDVAEYWNGGILWLSVSDFNHGYRWVNTAEKTITEFGVTESSATILNKGDIIISARGTVGVLAQLSRPMAFNQSCYGMRSKSEVVDIDYLYYSIKHSLKHFQQVTYGGVFDTITRNSFQFIKINHPPLPEQKAIATALSDIDDLINSLIKLIEKKKHIKQGAMQELLTGKKRLDGFSGEWVEVRLGDICERVTTGKLDANAMIPDGHYRFYTCAKEYYWINGYAFDDEALLISGNGANVGYIHYYKGKFNADQRTYVLTGISQNIMYIKVYLDKHLADRISAEVNAGNTPYIKMNTLTDMIISMPLTIEEQTAIATILSDMDTEIETLQANLNKYKAIKQGMMQELLTGRIRLLEGA
jgi:type I restriction enzyme, S subunit